MTYKEAIAEAAKGVVTDEVIEKIAWEYYWSESKVRKDIEAAVTKEIAGRLMLSYQNGYKAGMIAEREACLKLCEEIVELFEAQPARQSGADECVAAIEMRGGNDPDY
jgi:hypothetical protein